MLKERILRKESGYLFYGITPPKENTEAEKVEEIAARQIERLHDLGLDGLVLYDIQDESSRTQIERPFPYLPTLAPDFYSENYLKELKIPKIIYKSVGKFTTHHFSTWINNNSNSIECSVFVGSPSKNQMDNLTLGDAYKLVNSEKPGFILGGITIPERHEIKGDEHLRVISKINKGCNFFISQCVYSINHTKNFLSDYYYTSLENKQDLVPIIFTLTPCGSLRTLDFMKWLGIDIPVWLYNDLKHSNDILAKSIEVCKSLAHELIEYCKNKNIPIGFNIESVAIRKVEIEASIELLKYIKGIL